MWSVQRHVGEPMESCLSLQSPMVSAVSLLTLLHCSTGCCCLRVFLHPSEPADFLQCSLGLYSPCSRNSEALYLIKLELITNFHILQTHSVGWIKPLAGHFDDPPLASELKLYL